MDIANLVDFGSLIRQSRTAAGLTQEDVMFAANVSKSFLRDVEHGKPSCQFDRVIRVAQVVGLSLSANSTLIDGPST